MVRCMIGFGEARRLRAVLSKGAALVLSIPACVVPSRGAQQPPASPPVAVAVEPWHVPPSQVPPPAVQQRLVAEPSPPASSCETQYVPPFDGATPWRVAYRGNAAGAFHACPGWSGFGPVRPNRKWHKGLDIAAPTGTPIRTAVAGTLSYGRDPHGWGLYARVRFVPSRPGRAGTCESTEPMEFIYAHLREDIPAQVIRSESPVAAGAIIGRVGCSGNAAGMCSPSPESHVHVTLRKSQGTREKVDPLPVVRWNLGEPSPADFSPPLLACPMATGQTSASAR